MSDRLIEAAQVIREHARTQGHTYTFIYAIQAGDDGPVKIGKTNKPAERIKTLQQANAEHLRGIACWRAPHDYERWLHDDFAHLRIRGEWFQPAPELIEMVTALGGEFEDWTE